MLWDRSIHYRKNKTVKAYVLRLEILFQEKGNPIINFTLE